MKVLVLVFHPNLKDSTVNRTLATALSDNTQVIVRDMYALYPKGNIDVEEEHRYMEDADRVILQFPMHWYSSPALLKEWEDCVFEYGWAYGSKGTALHGKELMIAISTGAGEEEYRPAGKGSFDVPTLLYPFEATSRLIGMTYMTPFVVYGASSIEEQCLQQVAEDYVAAVTQA